MVPIRRCPARPGGSARWSSDWAAHGRGLDSPPGPLPAAIGRANPNGVPGSLVGEGVAMHEIVDFGTVVLLVAASSVAAVVSTKLSARLRVPAPAVLLLAAAVASALWPTLQQSAGPPRRADRRRRLDRDPLQRRDRDRIPSLSRLGRADPHARPARNVHHRGCRRCGRPLRARLRVDAGRDHRGRDLAHRPGGHVLRPRRPRDRRPLGNDAEGRGRRQRSRRDRVDDRHDRAGAAPARVAPARRTRVRRRDGDRTRSRSRRSIRDRRVLRRIRLASEGFYPVLALALAACLYGVTSAPPRLRLSRRLPRRPLARKRAHALQGGDRALPGRTRQPRRADRLRCAGTHRRHHIARHPHPR